MCSTAARSYLVVHFHRRSGRSIRLLLLASTDYEPSFRGCGCVKPRDLPLCHTRAPTDIH